MNYIKHYTLLIERAKNRQLGCYVEKHHILPNCLDGSNDKENIVSLTPEEHYIAHQLLLKIYPDKPGLIFAAIMMACKSSNQERNNKLYGWLRRKHSESMRIIQRGENNPNFGNCWISNFEDKKCKSIKKHELPIYLEAGWVKKRVIKWPDKIKCPQCNKLFYYNDSKYCSKNCKSIKLKERPNNQMDMFNEKLKEMVKNCKNGVSIYKSLRIAGFCGTGKAHERLKRIIKDIGE